MASSERIFTLLDTPAIISARPPAPAPAAGAGRRGRDRLRPRLVRLPRARTTCCSDVSFEVEPGRARRHRRRDRRRASRRSSTCCCGSTTCSRGRILVDGVDVRDLRAEQAARRCSAWCSRTCTCSRAPSPATSASGATDLGRRAGAAGGRGGARRIGSSTRLPGGHRRAGRRARRDALGRPEAAAVVRAGAGVRSADPDPRRGDVERRHRDRTADPGRAAGADGRPDDHRDRPPPVDHPGHGPHPRAPQGRAARVGQPTRSCSPRAGSTTGCISCSTRTRSTRRRAAPFDSRWRRALAQGKSALGSRLSTVPAESQTPPESPSAAERRCLPSRKLRQFVDGFERGIREAGAPASGGRATAAACRAGSARWRAGSSRGERRPPARTGGRSRAPRRSSTCRCRAGGPHDRAGVQDRVDAVVLHAQVRRPGSTDPAGRTSGSAAAIPVRGGTPDAVTVPSAVGRGLEPQARAGARVGRVLAHQRLARRIPRVEMVAW